MSTLQISRKNISKGRGSKSDKGMQEEKDVRKERVKFKTETLQTTYFFFGLFYLTLKCRFISYSLTSSEPVRMCFSELQFDYLRYGYSYNEKAKAKLYTQIS